MTLGLLILAIAIGGVLGLITFIAWLDNGCNGLFPLISIGAFVAGIVGCCLYGIAENQIETELYLRAEVLGDDTQYIQYDHPDHELPIVINVNKRFGRVMSEFDLVRVTIYSEGPYNGVYKRPGDKIELVDTPGPPAPPCDYYEGQPQIELHIMPCPPPPYPEDENMPC